MEFLTVRRSGSGLLLVKMSLQEKRPITSYSKPTQTRCVHVCECVCEIIHEPISPFQDGKLSADEVVEAFDIFIDSQVTDFGHSIHDEL